MHLSCASQTTFGLAKGRENLPSATRVSLSWQKAEICHLQGLHFLINSPLAKGRYTLPFDNPEKN